MASRKTNLVTALVPGPKVIAAVPPVKAAKTAFVVENNVPMPVRKRNARSLKSKYPFLSMKKNDSFLVPGAKLSTINATVVIWNKRIRLPNKNFAKFSARSVEGGVRVWRVK